MEPAHHERGDERGQSRAPAGVAPTGDILVLPNAWDRLCARAFESCGFPAVATTSAGIAYSFGYLDGERLSREEIAGATKRTVGAVSVLVTADGEAA